MNEEGTCLKSQHLNASEWMYERHLSWIRSNKIFSKTALPEAVDMEYCKQLKRKCAYGMLVPTNNLEGKLHLKHSAHILLMNLKKRAKHG